MKYSLFTVIIIGCLYVLFLCIIISIVSIRVLVGGCSNYESKGNGK